MEPPVNARLTILLDPPEPPCLSLYQPTHRRHPDNQQDPIRYRNLLKTLEDSLLRKYSTQQVTPLLGPMQALAADAAFWNHTSEGLAVFSAQGIFEVFTLLRPVPERAIAADSFHLGPLLRILQSADRYQVLGLNQQAIKLFEGNRDRLEEIKPVQGVPSTITAALGEELSEPRLVVGTYGTGPGGPGRGGGSAGMRHGHGGKKDEVDIDRDRFFRAIDRAITEHHSKPAALPLIVAALAQHHAHFQDISHNPFLVPDGIKAHPDAISMDALRESAWQVMEPRFRARIAELVERFGAARARQLASADVSDIAAAAAAGRVESLLVEADRQLPGRLDAVSGRIGSADSADPEVDDLIDDVAELVLRRGGNVWIVPADQMPTDSGLAAIYRF